MKTEKILIVDVESTCWLTDRDKKIDETPPNEKSEIIEIGAVLLRTGPLKDITRFPLFEDYGTIYVKPEHSTISEFCSNLNGVTQDILDKYGISFMDACKLLQNRFNSKQLVWASYGDYDKRMFEQQCKEHGIEYPFGPRHINIKVVLATLLGLKKEVGLAHALQIMGLKLEGRHHSGISDSINTARIYQKLSESCKLYLKNGF